MPASRSTMPAGAGAKFDPSAIGEFRFLDRTLSIGDGDPGSGTVRLRYALDDAIEFEERFELPVGGSPASVPPAALDGALDLLQLAAGVSYFKAADPPAIDTGNLRMTPALAELGTLLYGPGLAEFRFTNDRPVANRPAFAVTANAIATTSAYSPPDDAPALVPVGGGKDSVVTIEALKRAGHEITLCSVGDMEPIARTAAIAGRPRLVATRRLDRGLLELNVRGALNGHVPVTAIVSAVAVLAALLNDHTAVVMSNERSAGSGSFERDGVDVNHQFSKGFAAEEALAAAVRELIGGVDYFSMLRPASELAIARAFADMTEYHQAFTSCNAVFRIDPARRASNWCGDCPKCRFVWLILAPFLTPAELIAIFGNDMYDDESQYDGFAALVGIGAEKPFECVGTVEESVAAVRMTAGGGQWAGHPVLERLAAAIDAAQSGAAADPRAALTLSSDHQIPDRYLDAVHETLGS